MKVIILIIIIIVIVKLYNKYQIIKLIDKGYLPILKKDGRFRKSINRSLVKVTQHGGSCEQCKKWEKKILIDDLFSGGIKNDKYHLLSEAIKDGLFHEGCRHGLTTYYPELDEEDN